MTFMQLPTTLVNESVRSSVLPLSTGSVSEQAEEAEDLVASATLALARGLEAEAVGFDAAEEALAEAEAEDEAKEDVTVTPPMVVTIAVILLDPP